MKDGRESQAGLTTEGEAMPAQHCVRLPGGGRMHRLYGETASKAGREFHSFSLPVCEEVTS